MRSLLYGFTAGVLIVALKGYSQPIDLASALDATNLIWTTSSNAPWFPETAYSYDGAAAAQDGANNNRQASTLQTTVTGPATIRFWWRLQNYGSPYLTSLGFSINGALQTNMTAEIPWQRMTYYLGSGVQTLRWIYTNISSAGVFNGGWVDQVNFEPGPTPPTVIAPPPDRTILAGGATTFSINAVGTPLLNYQWQFNGTNIAGATKSAYILANVQATNQGTYGVRITNAFGSAVTYAVLSVTPSAPVFTTQPTNFISVPRGNAVFFGKAAGSEPITYQWQFGGTNLPGATNTTLFLSALRTSQAGNYQLGASNALAMSNSALAVLSLVPSMIVPWGNNVNGLFNIATGVTNAIGISGGYYHDLALRADGFVVGAGQNIFGEALPPPGLSNVMAVSAGDYFSVALKNDGTVTAWGEDPTIYAETRVPPNLTNVIAISGGYENTLALKRDRTVTAWGANSYGETNVPPGLSNVMAVSEGEVFSVALKNDGRVVAWGDNANGETNVATVSNVVAVAAGVYATFVLRNDGTVSFFGLPSFINIPSGLSNVVAIAAGDGQNGFALKRDGTVAGLTVFSTAPPAWLTNVVQISAGQFCNLAIVNDGAPFIEQNPWPQTVYSASAASFNVVSVGVEPLSYQWSFNGTNLSGGTDPRLTLSNVPLTSAGNYQCVVTNAFGAVTSAWASLTVLRSTPRFENLVYGLSNGLTLNVSGLSGHGPVLLYHSTNLSTWIPISTNPASVGVLQLMDATATNSPVRFYRVVEQ